MARSKTVMLDWTGLEYDIALERSSQSWARKQSRPDHTKQSRPDRTRQDAQQDLQVQSVCCFEEGARYGPGWGTRKGSTYRYATPDVPGRLHQRRAVAWITLKCCQHPSQAGPWPLPWKPQATSPGPSQVVNGVRRSLDTKNWLGGSSTVSLLPTSK